MSLLSAPWSSRTLPNSMRASSSMTPFMNFTPRSSHFARMMAMRVSKSGAPMSTIKPPDKRVMSRSSTSGMSEG